MYSIKIVYSPSTPKKAISLESQQNWIEIRLQYCVSCNTNCRKNQPHFSFEYDSHNTPEHKKKVGLIVSTICRIFHTFQ